MPLTLRTPLDMDMTVIHKGHTRTATVRGPLTEAGRSHGLYRLQREVDGVPKRNALYGSVPEAVEAACAFCLDRPRPPRE